MSRVVATQTGYYNGKRRDPDEEFGLTKRSDFSANWMKPIGWSVGDAEDAGEKPAPKSEAKPAMQPIRASTETTVTPPPQPPKSVNPITGKADAPKGNEGNDI